MPVGWPNWVPDENRFAELARYASPYAVGELGLIPPGVQADVGDEEYQYVAYRRVEMLYGSLQSKDIPISGARWRSGDDWPALRLRTQRLKPPAEAVRGPATHLDLAVLFAGMLLNVGARALLVCGEARPTHPLICVDLRRPLRFTPDLNDRWPPRARPTTPGVAQLEHGQNAASIGRLTRDRGWLLIDPSLAAASDLRADFGTASGASLVAELSETPEPPQRWYLVDVARVRQDAGAYEPPRGLAVSAISSYLPSPPMFVRYRSRADVLARLDQIARPGGNPTVLVLQGPTGVGKSTIALNLANAVDFGCGWVLDAVNANTLQASLAQAYASEYASVSDALDAASVQTLAAAAQTQLADSRAPWVVVVDDCDVAPDTPGLASLIPVPHARGQLVIITTTNDQWRRYAEQSGWHFEAIPELSTDDLTFLGLPLDMREIVDGLPLIAQILNTFEDLRPIHFQDLSHHTHPGSALAWEMLRRTVAEQDVVHVARTLAWCPSASNPVDSVLAVAGNNANVMATRRLEHHQFVHFTESGGRTAIQMHRLIASAIREQTWRESPAAAMEIIKSLVLTNPGRTLLSDCADGTVLRQLEADVDRASDNTTSGDDRGRLWHALGSIWYARGQAGTAAYDFQRAIGLLDRSLRPLESAECLIGLARIIIQDAFSSEEDLVSADSDVAIAVEMLSGRPDTASRHLRAQALGLGVVVQRKLSEYAEDSQKWILLTELLNRAWNLYEERVRLAQGLPANAVVGRVPPQADWGDGPDRAYYNLAGFYVKLARHLDGRDMTDALEQAGLIYSHCRLLRERKHSGRPHADLAACINGEAIVAYYQAVWDRGAQHRLLKAIELSTTALTMRSSLANSTVDIKDHSLFGDVDVQKTMTLLLKTVMAGLMVSGADLKAAEGRVDATKREALAELNRQSKARGDRGNE